MNNDTSLDPDIITGEQHRHIVATIRADRDAWKTLAKSSALANLFAALILIAMLVTWLVTR